MRRYTHKQLRKHQKHIKALLNSIENENLLNKIKIDEYAGEKCAPLILTEIRY